MTTWGKEEPLSSQFCLLHAPLSSHTQCLACWGEGIRRGSKPHLDPSESEDLETVMTINISILTAR